LYRLDKSTITTTYPLLWHVSPEEDGH